jgi:hypothetical protein
VVIIELINKIKTKKAAHRAYKQSNSYSDYHAFLNLTSHCKSLAKSYLDSYMDDVIRNSKQFESSSRAVFTDGCSRLPGSSYMWDGTLLRDFESGNSIGPNAAPFLWNAVVSIASVDLEGVGCRCSPR